MVGGGGNAKLLDGCSYEFVKVWLVWRLWVRMSKSERLILWAPLVQVENHDLYGHHGSRSTHRGL